MVLRQRKAIRLETLHSHGMSRMAVEAQFNGLGGVGIVRSDRVALHSGDMPVEETRAGWIAFEIPTSTSTLTISWTDDSKLSPPVELKTLTYGSSTSTAAGPPQDVALMAARHFTPAPNYAQTPDGFGKTLYAWKAAPGVPTARVSRCSFSLVRSSWGPIQALLHAQSRRLLQVERAR